MHISLPVFRSAYLLYVLYEYVPLCHSNKEMSLLNLRSRST